MSSSVVHPKTAVTRVSASASTVAQVDSQSDISLVPLQTQPSVQSPSVSTSTSALEPSRRSRTMLVKLGSIVSPAGLGGSWKTQLLETSALMAPSPSASAALKSGA